MEFLHRNLGECYADIKKHVNILLGRPQLEFASVINDLYKQRLIGQQEISRVELYDLYARTRTICVMLACWL